MFEKLEQVARAVVLSTLTLAGAGCGTGYNEPLPAQHVFKTLKDNVDNKFPAFTPEQREMYLQIVEELESKSPKDLAISLHDADMLSDSIANTFMIDNLRPAGEPSQRRSRAIY